MKETDKKTLPLPGVPEPNRPTGRPRLYASAADRQKAYRERLKIKGMRVISRITRDIRDDAPLQSSIIDLSEVRKTKGLK